MGARLREFLHDIRVFWKTLVVLLAPLFLLPIPLIYRHTEVQCAYAIIVMAVYMITECIPMAVTSLLPVVFFSMFGLVPISVLAGCYMRNIQLLMIGSLMMAVAVERCNLHKRVALKILLLVGTSPRRLLMGVIVATGFLSMFVANTPTTAMMIPVVEAIINELKSHAQGTTAVQDAENGDAITGDNEGQTDQETQKEDNLSTADNEEDIAVNVPHDQQSATHNKGTYKMLAIAICYSGNVGGTATLTGNFANLVAYDYWRDYYAARGQASPVSYSTWIPAGLPGAVIMLILIWVWLQIYFLRGFAEKSNLVFFIILVLLWFFRDPGFMRGFGDLFPKNYITDAVPAVLIAVLLFIFPSEKPQFMCFRKRDTEAKSVPALLQWSTTYPHLAWTSFFIMGGGFAISEAAQVSGLGSWLGSQLEALKGLHSWIVSLIGSLLVSALTQVTSNVATSSLTQPIILSLSESIGAHPLRLAMPAVFACSSAFMLPASTAPNAMVFEKGHFTVIDMILCGFIINIAFVLVSALGTETWMSALFDLGTYPFESDAFNSTTTPYLLTY